MTLRPAPDREAPAAGHYELRDHPDVKGLIAVYWCTDLGATLLLTIGPSRVPLLAEALAEWEVAHQIPAPRRHDTRTVTDDGAV